MNETSLDLVELSGGSLEQPKPIGATVRDEGEDRWRAPTWPRGG
jgi:hypothetical protein